MNIVLIRNVLEVSKENTVKLVKEHAKHDKQNRLNNLTSGLCATFSDVVTFILVVAMVIFFIVAALAIHKAAKAIYLLNFKRT